MAETDKVFDYCNFTGKFFGYAFTKCNLKQKTVNNVPIVIPKLPNYDLHQICKILTLFSDDSEVQAIHVTDENFLSLAVEFRVTSCVENRGVE